MSPAKTADPIEMPGAVFIKTCVVPRNNALDEVHKDVTWQIRLNDSCLTGMLAVATVTVAACTQNVESQGR